MMDFCGICESKGVASKGKALVAKRKITIMVPLEGKKKKVKHTGQFWLCPECFFEHEFSKAMAELTKGLKNTVKGVRGQIKKVEALKEKTGASFGKYELFLVRLNGVERVCSKALADVEKGIAK